MRYNNNKKKPKKKKRCLPVADGRGSVPFGVAQVLLRPQHVAVPSNAVRRLSRQRQPLLLDGRVPVSVSAQDRTAAAGQRHCLLQFRSFAYHLHDRPLIALY